MTMENDEMIYTAIFQSKDGTLFRAEYLGEMSRKTAWHNAAKMECGRDSTLLVLVPGNHPIHTYESLFGEAPPPTKRDNPYEVTVTPDDDVYEMT